MSNELLNNLAEKIDNAIETIELLNMQTEELDNINKQLHIENTKLKEKQSDLEKKLTTMLEKLIQSDKKEHHSKTLTENLFEDKKIELETA